MLWSRRQKKDDMQCPVRNSFPRRGRIGFMGGAAVSFVLADKEDTVLDGNTYAHYGITGGKLDDYAGRNLAEVRYPLVVPAQGLRWALGQVKTGTVDYSDVS